jgi:hypothetical protein
VKGARCVIFAMTRQAETNRQFLEKHVIPCLCDQSDWPNMKRLYLVRIRPNPRPYPLTFKVCLSCRYVVGLEDPDPDEKFDRSSPTVRTIAKMLKWKLGQ